MNPHQDRRIGKGSRVRENETAKAQYTRTQSVLMGPPGVSDKATPGKQGERVTEENIKYVGRTVFRLIGHKYTSMDLDPLSSTHPSPSLSPFCLPKSHPFSTVRLLLLISLSSCLPQSTTYKKINPKGYQERFKTQKKVHLK